MHRCSRCNKENTEFKEFVMRGKWVDLLSKFGLSINIKICQKCVSKMLRSCDKDK